MSTLDYRTQLRTQQGSLPTPTGNATYGPARGNRYGELYATPTLSARWNHALEGSYFIAHNATNDASTTLAGHAAPVLADADATMTKPFVFIRNPTSSSSNTLIVLDFIEIEVVTAGANGTTASWAAQIDTGATRRSSGGTALTIVNPNMQQSNDSVLDETNALLGGAVVAGAENSTSRDLGFGDLRPTIEIAGDKKLFIFGGDPRDVTASAAAAVRTQVVNMPPVVLGSTDQFLLALYAPSQSSAGVYKLRLGWVERSV